MRHFEGEENFIRGIYNYCDKWCERCEFTKRCRTFAMEAEIFDGPRPGESEGDALVRGFRDIFAEAKQLLEEKAAEMGFEITPLTDEEFDAMQEREKAFLKSDDLIPFAEKYVAECHTALAEKEEWLKATDDPIIDDMVEIVRYYQFFIPGKIHRAVNDTFDSDTGEIDPEQFDDPQSDANGSVKIALIAIERSLLAWEYLAAHSKTTRPQASVRLLETIRSIAENRFPKSRDFIRPGFDDAQDVYLTVTSHLF